MNANRMTRTMSYIHRNIIVQSNKLHFVNTRRPTVFHLKSIRSRRRRRRHTRIHIIYGHKVHYKIQHSLDARSAAERRVILFCTHTSVRDTEQFSLYYWRVSKRHLSCPRKARSADENVSSYFPLNSITRVFGKLYK